MAWIFDDFIAIKMEDTLHRNKREQAPKREVTNGGPKWLSDNQTLARKKQGAGVAKQREYKVYNVKSAVHSNLGTRRKKFKDFEL